MLLNCLGQPLAGATLRGFWRFSVSVSVDVPLVTKRRRGSEDLRRRGMKVCVMICVPVVLTFHDLFQSSRMVMRPAWYSGSNWAPRWC